MLATTWLRRTTLVGALLLVVLGATRAAEYEAVEAPELVLQDGFLWQPHRSRIKPGRVDWDDIEKGKWSAEQLRKAGELLFIAQFTREDGAGRPGATGNPSPTRRPLGTGQSFVRTAGPDANACASCHNRPNVGGAGDFVANVFAGLGARHPIFLSTDPSFSAERDTPELHGAGAIELLAREMTTELHTIRARAIAVARANSSRIRLPLTAKGVEFGHIIANADGTADLHEIEGIDRDLVVRPWGQKGVVTSLRTFTVNAMNLHHGMQAVERFGFHLTGSADFDRDGMTDELSEGDIAALVVFQATVSVPGRVLPRDAHRRRLMQRGEELFRASRCAHCHKPELPLDSTMFTEPSLYNLEGTLRGKDVTRLLEFDLAKTGPGPHLAPSENGRYYVRAFTDLKRHRISDAERPHFGNETMVEGLTSIDEFITRRLWAVGSTAPYGHRGDLTTLREAIHHHGGEARESRLEFEGLAKVDQDAIIEFLQSLQVVPNGSSALLIEPRAVNLPYVQE